MAKAIQRNKWRPENVVLIGEVLRVIWNERNTTVFSQNYSKVPNWVVLQNMERRLLAMLDATTSTRKARQLQQPMADLQRMLLPWRHKRNVAPPLDIEHEEIEG